MSRAGRCGEPDGAGVQHLLFRKTKSALSPLWGRVGEGVQRVRCLWLTPLSLTLPHKGGGNE